MSGIKHQLNKMFLEWDLPYNLHSWLIVIRLCTFLKSSYVIYLILRTTQESKPDVNIIPISQMTKWRLRETDSVTYQRLHNQEMINRSSNYKLLHLFNILYNILISQELTQTTFLKIQLKIVLKHIYILDSGRSKLC